MATPDVLHMSIYDMPTSPPLWDKVGRFYVAFACTWTFLLLAGMAFCVANRNNPVLKVRGLPLSFGSILLLHSYWILAQITYPIARSMPVVLAYDIQYFFMGIYFPLGIALFHASNLRFLRVAKLQKQFTTARPPVTANKRHGAETSLLRRIRNMDYTARTMVFIGTGMVAQIALTVGMWFACKKYHPTFGLPGTQIKGDTLPEQLADLGRGWEWWPSLVWQVVWAWMVAPYLIWRAWGIRDTMGWRTQTIACCLAKIHLSIIFFEIFTVFVPACELVSMWFVRRRVDRSNAKWDTASQLSVTSQTVTLAGKGSTTHSLSLSEKGRPLDFLDEELGDRLLTMAALDHVLRDNPGPLQEFSALNDFSGENVAFLTRVAGWRASWPLMPAGAREELDVFNEALAIYADFISPRDAEFPLNLASRELKLLEDVFEKPARAVCGEPPASPAVPFDLEAPPPPPSPSRDGSHPDLGTLVRYRGQVPAGFSLAVFDNVQSHIKYLVLTNTWPKFVSEMQSRRRSSETGRSVLTDTSGQSHGSRLSARLARLLRDLGV
ncbi:Regulator of G protein signaling superfamily [Metarhizium album ARSEF 1941]|uniref:Regulator of G protein signaling superfamily n=1 Tax=Metarhizium album (strain ARSEF 1941) TaxID=1081103 RepID=A0A0B2WNH7_METAS|nr:Regulator of G protein signaling superfamily [Metarhizium album ARSEF 1941]KHN95204.1 Regulator of G protein signaling superfamily [Metarhizium album ARSEF 1941]